MAQRAAAGSSGILFRQLLGAAFDRLDAPVRAIHEGRGAQYRGSATVERGAGWLAQLACRVAHLPQDVRNAPLSFRLEVQGSTEEWTRCFSGSVPMQSRLSTDGALLVEHLGPAVARFELTERDGALLWQAVSLRVLGIPIPRRAFDFRARVRGRGPWYRFEIDAHLALIGRLIRYQGELHVTG
jgi:Domain of unknown function (DUF4166)